ncbi:MAG: hypothetical protein HKN41_07030, partial [Ilumatobacter sp.]|nr:hypothetical protein [Ilumatobacter sp.]
QRAGEYAARSFGEFRTSPLATVVARSAAALGDRENALRWLGAAAAAAAGETAGHRRLLAQTMDAAAEFTALRQDPTFAGVRGELV